MALSRGRCLLQSLLDQIGMSQSELARRSGVSQRMISFYINNKRRMSYDAARAIANVLGCRMEDLYESD